MILYFAGIFFFPVFYTGVPKIVNVLFFLCINRDDRLPGVQILMGGMVNKFKLFITVWAWYAGLLHFLVHMFAVAHFCQKLGYLFMACSYVVILFDDIPDFTELRVDTTSAVPWKSSICAAINFSMTSVMFVGQVSVIGSVQLLLFGFCCPK